MHILTLHCPDQPGIVARVSNCLHDSGCNIEDSSQFNDHLSGHFFMRVVFSESRDDGFADFKACFQNTANHYDMTWNIYDGQPVRTLLMVSKYDHCLRDILYREETGHLNTQTVAIVSNHTDTQKMVEQHNIPFHHLPVTKDNKVEQEQALKGIIEQTGSELIVLARYMQVLSDAFCNSYPGKVMNIHHSFLPGFKGARPYHQAYERGVKIIGATAHFATAELDEGPIIEQDTINVTHADTPEKMQMMGQDTEARTLRNAIEKFSQRRIFLHEGRTIIL